LDLATYTPNNKLYDAALFGAAMNILHETTHYGDIVNNGHLTNEELGKQNKKSYYNHRGLDTEQSILLGADPRIFGQNVSGLSGNYKWGGLGEIKTFLLPPNKNPKGKNGQERYKETLNKLQNNNPEKHFIKWEQKE